LTSLFCARDRGQNWRRVEDQRIEDKAMAESELYQKGAAMRRQLMGDAAVEQSAREIYSDPVMKKFIDVATETVFGALWTRPGLDLKTRALICVISDTATGREPELGLHLRMALRQGWTEEELTEALLQLSGYVGVPIIRESMMVASKVFAEFRAELVAAKPATR
jgi:4-carboxymuconolactone decarboxylase